MFNTNSSKIAVYRKARNNGYHIERGKRHYISFPLYERQDGTYACPIVRDKYGNPEYGYEIFDDFGIYVNGCINNVFDRCFDWQDVVTFVNSL